jgi:hypothetical protein
MIETPRGFVMRRVASASPLPQDVRPGRAAEEATDDAAALWGMPDFLYRASVLRAGTGVREIGDRLLIVGDAGIVVQVKSRGGFVADEAKERRWLEKHVAKGLRQAHGTIRRLRSATARLTNARGRTIEVDGNAIRWVGVVVIDHPAPPEGFVHHVANQPNPAVVLLRRDWEFLFDQLKSTHAVVSYLERVAPEAIELGEEPVRYYGLAQADAEATPRPMRLEALGPTARSAPTPLLPLAPAGVEDRMPHMLVRAIFEDIAVGGLSGTTDERDRLRTLAALDRLYVSTRHEIGWFLLEAMEFVSSPAEGETVWRQRRAVTQELGPPLQLAFAACSKEWGEMVRDLFTAWLELRHYEIGEALGRAAELTSVGVLLTPRRDGVRPWDTTSTFISGELDLDEDTVEAYRTVWPLEKAQETAAGLG